MNAVVQLERWKSKAEIAEFFGVSQRTIQYWTAAGMPSAIIASRRKYRESECEPWLERSPYMKRSA